MIKYKNNIHLIILLAVLSAIAPMAVDTYIPSIPTMAKEFHVGIEKIELTLTIFLIGFAIGQIFGGVISDRIGRKKSSIIGLLGFAFFSFIIIFSTTSFELLLYRFIEAFFGGLIVVNASAIVRDKFTTQEAAKVFSLIGTVRSIAPLIAPAIGAFIIHFFSWKAVFIFLTFYALLVAIWVYKELKETFTYSNQSIVQSYQMVLTNKNAMQIIVVLALGFSGMFIIIAKSPFIYMEYFGISSDFFPLYFGFSIIALMIMISVNLRLLKRYTPLFLIKMAVLFQILIAVLFLLFSNTIGLYFTLVLIASYISLNGFIYGNCTALAMESFSKNAGVASAVIGVVQFGLGALITSIVVFFHTETLVPIALSLVAIPLLSFLVVKQYK
ncbi:multidrug effflux MFS transporter [Arcobacter sp. FWKO B]|uniref:multidrug effflux MFS transporter n=1 Tax=Arcobacter sp. FWKO B TaxID=2593672 RepID=UPI0018A35E86|nr:multidrug effflux MFS transporter [Arcobacter sp. FWKO B]QOG13134.1 multidrug effflux MFS transporter [Arcobacter sp. FWKO B]